jgi:hypothetical protein
MVTEAAPPGDPHPETYGVFSARFGNIYTVRQLLQLFTRAYALFHPQDDAWLRPDGHLVDPFRPQITPAGFASEAELQADRRRHLACVRAMFEDCDVFIFTLGLTEHWMSARDGAVFPLAPGVVGGEPGPDYAFGNFKVAEIVTDFRDFLRRLRVVNPMVRVIITVSPVPLIATYTPGHVLAANTYSKSALRAAAQEIAEAEEDLFYFPSFEMITGPHAGARYFADDLRSVTAEGVAYVMETFSRHVLADGEAAPRRPRPPSPAPGTPSQDVLRAHDEIAAVICDEDALES